MTTLDTLPLGRSFQPLDRLHLAQWNPRTIGEPQFKALMQSIRERPHFMIRRPLLVADGPEHHAGGIVHGGNMRTRALQQLYKDGWRPPEPLEALGWTRGMAPVDVEDIGEQEAQAQALIDNNSWGEWNEDELAELVHGLGTAGFDLDLLGFDTQQLAALLEGVGAGPDNPKGQLPPPRDLGVDAIFTINQQSEAGCCLAVKAGLKYGFQSGNKWCPRADQIQGRHRIAFIDNEYTAYNHQVHLDAVKLHRPKYCTVRDIMTERQCKAAGIAYYSLEQILEWAEELGQYAQFVIVIPKYDCLDHIPDKYNLGYSVPSSHGATPLPWEAFVGRRVHLLGGAWRAQLGYLAVLGRDVVSLDNNHIQKVSNFGQFVTADGDLRNIGDLGLGNVTNPRYIAMSISFGLVASKLNELYPNAAEPDADAGVQAPPVEGQEGAPANEVVNGIAAPPNGAVPRTDGPTPPPAPVMIRPARAEDVVPIQDVAKKLSKEIGWVMRPALQAAVTRGELLVDEGTHSFVHYHRRRDGVTVVYEIAVPVAARGRGIGRMLVDRVPTRPIELKCPVDNASNKFYAHLGFTLLRTDPGRKRRLNVWRLDGAMVEKEPA